MNNLPTSILQDTLAEAIEDKLTLKIFLINGVSLTTNITEVDDTFAVGVDKSNKSPMLINLSHIVSLTITTRGGNV